MLPPGPTLPFPLEIREIIYADLRLSSPSTLTSLVRTSKATYKETIPYLYKHITLSSSTGPLFAYGLETKLTTWNKMVQGRKSGGWFKDFDLGRYEAFVLSAGIKPEIRKLVLLSLVRCVKIEDEEGLKALGSIICYYQRPLPEDDRSNSIPRRNAVFKGLERLCLSSACVRAICRIVESDWRYYHGRLKAHRVIFDHVIPGISPSHLCVESWFWKNSVFCHNNPNRFMREMTTAFQSFSLHWPLETITMNRLFQWEGQIGPLPIAVKEIIYHFASLSEIRPAALGWCTMDTLSRETREGRRTLVRSTLINIHRSHHDQPAANQSGPRTTPRIIIEGDTSFIPRVIVVDSDAESSDNTDLPTIRDDTQPMIGSSIPTSTSANSSSSQTARGRRPLPTTPDLSWLGPISNDPDPLVDERLKGLTEVRNDDEDGDGVGVGGCQCVRDSGLV
ncbi:hypothetical protein IAT40_004298 [Kwoniella sp. CBS 6097]